jgi:hypothetical protein
MLLKAPPSEDGMSTISPPGHAEKVAKKKPGRETWLFKTYTFNGALRAKLEEPLCGIETYPVVWREPRFDLAELARLRWIKGLSYKELASRFGKTPNAIECHCREIRKRNFEVGLSKTELRQVRRAVGL